MNDLVKIMSQIVKDAQSAIRFPFRGVISYITPKIPVQTTQVEGLPGEVLQDMEFFQHFGFTSAPPSGTQCILLPLGGKTVHSIVIATENGNFRVQVDHGETCVYNQWGAKITLKKDRLVEVDCDTFVVKAKEVVDIQTKRLVAGASESADYLSPSLNFGSTDEKASTATMDINIEQNGWLRTAGDVIAAGVSLMDHVHKENGTGGSTDKPVAGAIREENSSEGDGSEVEAVGNVDWDVIPTKPLVVFVGGAADSLSDNMKETAYRYKNYGDSNGELPSSYQDIRYAHHDQKKKICELMRQYYYAGKPIAIVGHSWGGCTAARILPDPEYPCGSPIDLVITLDPVARYYKAPETKPALIKRWVNVFINSDLTKHDPSNSVAWLGGRWGHTPAADENIDMNALSPSYCHADSFNMLFKSGVTKYLEEIR